jgi:nicotinamide mononucleotide transporter
MTQLAVVPKVAIKNVFLQAAIIAVMFTGTTYALALTLGWLTPQTLNWFELVAGALSYVATFLCIKQKRAYAIVGIVGSILWAYVFWSNDLLASAVVNAYLAIILIYGYWRWGKDTNPRPVHHLAWKWVPVYALSTAVIYFGAVWITDALGGKMAFWDAAILVFTILAQLLQDQKVIFAWVVWGAVNVAGVILYFNTEIYFAMVQQLIFGFANIWGWMEWKKTMKEQEAVR